MVVVLGVAEFWRTMWEALVVGDVDGSSGGCDGWIVGNKVWSVL